MHHFIRQTLLIVWLGLVIPAATAQYAPPGIVPTETEKLADGLYAFRWGAYRSIFLVSDQGVIVTDPISKEAAVVYRQEIARITDQPVKYVVYSHAHWDHAAGGAIFKQEGAQFVAQQRCVDNIKSSPHPDIIMPDITFDKEYSVTVGDKSMDLFYYGPSHGTCLVAMIPRPHPMLYVVDVVTPPSGWYMPWDPQVADFHFYNIDAYLAELEALAEREGLQQVIASHLVPALNEQGKIAPSVTLGDIKAVSERRRFWQQSMAAVKAEMDKGTVSFIVHRKVDITPFKDTRGFNEKKFRVLLQRIASYYAIGR